MVLAKKALLSAALLGIAAGAAAQMDPKEKMAAALHAIQKNYVDSLPDEKLSDAAIAGMLQVLDPHSRYFSREEAEQMNQNMSGSFYGIGIQYVVEHDSVYITQVNPDGPAAARGLLEGDRIVAIDGNDITGGKLSQLEILHRLRGRKGSTVSLLVWRKASADTFTAELTRSAIPDRSVKSAYMVNDTTGYIALRIFNQTTRNEMDQALEKLKKQGLRNLILDLQGNGGGYVEAAIGVADEFLQRDQLVFYSVGQDKANNYYYTGGFGQFMNGKLVVLIDQNTASASEILSGALQDWDRAILVGRRSFGKGLMQKPVPLPDGSVLELTGARYYTPSGRSIQKPYHGATYSDNVNTRLASGELTNASVVHFADSLKHTTLVRKRTVYGGGGIMPDKYVPIDTVEYNGWLTAVAGAGLINKALFSFMDSNRTALQQQWPAFNTFLPRFTVPEEVIDQVVAGAQKAGLPLHPSSAARSRHLLAVEIKAQIAGQLYKGNDYYTQVLNTDNESYRMALDILSKPAVYNSLLPVIATPKKK